MWRPNPDVRDQELRRRAAAGDARAAHALAQSLLRKGQLTVQELVAIGAPAADALPEELRFRLVQILAPRVWSVVHTWEDPRGSYSYTFLSEAAALSKATSLALGVVQPATEWIRPGEYDYGDQLLAGYAEARQLLDSDPRAAWEAANRALDAIRELDADEQGNQIEIDWQEGPMPA